jgi:hypothetical protein
MDAFDELYDARERFTRGEITADEMNSIFQRSEVEVKLIDEVLALMDRAIANRVEWDAIEVEMKSLRDKWDADSK